MNICKLREGEEYIKLCQAMKKCGMESSGVDAKYDIQDGNVSVNGEIEIKRGRKLYDGDIIDYKGEQVVVKK